MKQEQLIRMFIKMFNCDTARISTPCGKLFLIIGWNRNTKDDPGQWLKDGKPFNFDYVKEKVIASGETEAELIESAKEYKRLSKMTWPEYFSMASV
jgi:hypothetical protein